MAYITIIIIITLLYFLFEDSFKKRKSYKKQISPNPVNRNQTNKPSLIICGASASPRDFGN